MNLLNLIEMKAGIQFELAGKVDGGEYSSSCPFCKDGEDRFRCWPSKKNPTWWCRQCMKSGGSISFLMQYEDIPHWVAVRELQDMDYPLDTQSDINWRSKEEKKLPPPTKRDFNVDTDIDQVEAWYISGRAKAISYFGRYGLTADDVDRCWLGWGEYKGRSGYTIPHWWIEGGQHYLKGVKMRHETLDKKKRFSTIDGSNTRGVFNMKWVSNPDGTRQGPVLNHLFIVEAEKDAILLDGMGYPTISFMPEGSWLQYLYRSLSNIVVPVIVYDEDGGGGLNRALIISDALRSKPMITSTRKWNVKSPSDLAKVYGRDAVLEWIKSVSPDIEVYQE